MATQTPRRPEEEIHGEPMPRPRFGPGSEDSVPAGNPTDPRGNDAPAGIASDPRGDKVASPEALESAESKGGGATTASSAAGKESHSLGHALGKGFNPMDSFKGSPLQRAVGLLARNKKKTVGGAIGGGIVGGGIFMFSIVQGPLQFIHFAQLLQKYHFSSAYDATDDRYSKMARYIYYRKSGDIERTRLGYFQNKYADRITEKLKAAGVESEYHQRFGYKTRTRITADLFNRSDLSAAEIKQKIDSEFPGAKTYIEGGNVYVNNRDMGFFKNRAFERHVLSRAGYSNVMAALNGRVMSKRAGYVLHPLKKLDRKALEKFDDALNKWRESRERTIGKGETIDPRFSNGNKDDPDNPDDDAQHQQGEEDTSKAKSSYQDFVSSKKFNAALGAAAVVGVGCTLKSLNEGYGEVKEKQVIAPSVRMALDVMSVGAQIQSGDDFNIQQLDFMNRQMHGEDSRGKKSSFNEAKSLLAEEGKKNTGVEESESLKSIGGGVPFPFVEGREIGDFLGAACSDVGNFAITIVSFAASPVASAATVAFDQAFGVSEKLQKLALDMLTGEAIDPLAAGADLGNAANYGARLAANSQMTSNGGQPLSKNEERQLAILQKKADEEELKSQSFFARMFNVYDHKSFASRMIDQSKPISPRNISQMATSAINPAVFLKPFSSMFSSTVKADTYTYDYGFPEVGFSASELQDPSVENPYANANKVVNNILPGNKKYIDKAEKCFGVQINESSYEATPSLDKTPSFETVNSDECKDGSKKWMQVRMYIFDSNIALSASCYEGDEPSCSSIGAGSATGAGGAAATTSTAGAKIDIANLTKPSFNIGCAPNTRDAGVIDGYTGGKKVRIRLCEIPNLPQVSGYGSKNGHATVNSRVSGAVYAMVEAARKDGVNMSASSSSRTMQDQQSLCPCDGVSVAIPGYSNHQLGVAIDFGGNGILMNRSNPMWKWLDKNAHSFDYKPYEVEPWHWSPTGS